LIVSDQPELFPAELLVRVSSKDDGSVLDRAVGVHDGSIVSNRTRFCDAIGVSYGQMVFQRIIYKDGATYDVLADVDEDSTTEKTSEVIADALFTGTAGVGLFLPVADCVATVVYDPVRKNLALLHLGRHSTFSSLISKTIRHFESRGSSLHDLIIWMSPSVHQDSYKLSYFEFENDPLWQGHYRKNREGYWLDMQGYNKQQFMRCGVSARQVHVSPVDTAKSPNYFSHSHGDTTGRFAVIAMMR
jgi:copper oxidase (laccase) domain-containing protein